MGKKEPQARDERSEALEDLKGEILNHKKRYRDFVLELERLQRSLNDVDQVRNESALATLKKNKDLSGSAILEKIETQKQQKTDQLEGNIKKVAPLIRAEAKMIDDLNAERGQIERAIRLDEILDQKRREVEGLRSMFDAHFNGGNTSKYYDEVLLERSTDTEPDTNKVCIDWSPIEKEIFGSELLRLGLSVSTAFSMEEVIWRIQYMCQPGSLATKGSEKYFNSKFFDLNKDAPTKSYKDSFEYIGSMFPQDRA